MSILCEEFMKNYREKSFFILHILCLNSSFSGSHALFLIFPKKVLTFPFASAIIDQVFRIDIWVWRSW